MLNPEWNGDTVPIFIELIVLCIERKLNRQKQ